VPPQRGLGALALAAAFSACQGQGARTGDGAAPGAGAPRTQGPNAAYDEGVAWAKKAETAPLPTPPPLTHPLPKGAALPPAPEFKPEEIQAVSFFEKAIADRPDDPRPHLALAELLGPHAAHRQEQIEQTSWKKKPARGKAAAPPPTPDPGGVDFSVERIVRAYEAAIENDPSSTASVEALINFAVRVKALDAAEGALQELVKRVKESPEPFLRYGDFMMGVKKDPEGAIEQYRQALIWRPDDETTRAKVAGIYLDMGSEAYARKQYAVAQTQFNEAAKYVTDKGSPQGLKVQDYQARIREIRGR
jgi:tetratricopeptide (TPR) repeat protein